MMGFLTAIYRASFCPLPKRLLLDLFDGAPEAACGIVLEEVGRPNGKVTTYRWWRTDQSAFFFFSKTESPLVARAERCDTTKGVQGTKEIFDELLSLVEAADRPALKNYSGDIRDGVMYSVSWGAKRHMRSLTVQNPAPESRYRDLIQILKENTWVSSQC